MTSYNMLKFENRRRDVISLNQPPGMLAKMAANGIRTHARTNQNDMLKRDNMLK